MSVKIQKEPVITEQRVEEEVQALPSHSFMLRMGTMLFDLAIALASLYFITFAILAYTWDKTPASESKAQALLRAAMIGPTIFPIVFALVFARFLTAVAAWRLERGITVTFLESLLAARSFGSTLIAPSKIKGFHIIFPALAIIWILSPIGGQSALRIVNIEPFTTTNLSTVQYLDTRTSKSAFSSSDTTTQNLGSINAAFNAALLGASSSRYGTQDVFGNLRIPMLETVADPTTGNGEGWYDTTSTKNVTYAALLGIPFAGIAQGANSSFNIETSYFSLDCTSSSKTSNSSSTSDDPSIEDGHMLEISIDPSHNISSLEARRIRIDASTTEAVCNLTTTYVEASVLCSMTGLCAVEAVRNSTINHEADLTTPLDGKSLGNGIAERFFWAFVNSTTRPGEEGATSSPIENYIADPSSTFSSRNEAPALANLDAKVFSNRLAQLLNTYYLASLGPAALTGGFSPTSSTYVAASTPATVATSQDALHCHICWLIILVVSSGIMFIAGCVTAILGLLRKGQDVLDDVRACLKGSPYVEVVEGRGLQDRRTGGRW
ncbi:hypothetical protein PRZ48_009384 [Zasmidium cellare]|uniref:Uncharacterized protein n=1 Tax=Zasmidium cellare TaxID=395010 RepID=A0ABR0EBK6_ZASCE|nr:hypothetical protein PRZ48_009384 [Zasmidium cellare]